MEEIGKQDINNVSSPKGGAAEAAAAYSSSTKRIAKNTLMLYFRQILIMLVSLYMVRVVLATLGAEDYGIYNVVAGVVVMFSFVNSAMASGTQRFLNFYLGKNDAEKTNQVYSASLVIHSLIALLFVAVAESAGLWFVGRKLNIPAERHGAAMAVYQLTILTTVFSILRVPYNATVIAHERMSFFALLSIVEAALKLVVVFLLQVAPFDKLIFYAFLLTAVALVVTLVYKLYCNKVFAIAHYKRVKDLGFVREQLSFSGWSLFGAVADISNSHGTNIVLNMFTNVTVNAAMGIANQVNAAVYSFVSNFQTAFNPQIVKSYADGDRKYFIRLICSASKASFLLLSFIAVPLVINCQLVLSLWLKNVPEHSVQFVQLTLLSSLVSAWNAPLWMSIQATGKIRKYQIIVSALIFANLPLSIGAMCMRLPPESVLVVRIGLAVATMGWRIFFLRNRIDLPRGKFIFGVLMRSGLVFLVSVGLTLLVGRFVEASVPYFFATCISSVVFTAALTFLIGLDKSERNYCINFIKHKIKGGR